MTASSRRLGTCLLISLAALTGASAESFYKQEPLFMFRPEETKSQTTINRFGPVGLSIDLVQPAFTMKIRSVEDGSPAAATGKLKPGQFIATINGEALKDIDPRIQLGNLITKAEATDGLIRLVLKDTPDAAAQTVDVKIPVLGAYSPTWPLDCPKSDQIVRHFAEYLKKDGSDKGFADMGMLFLLSTGDASDLEYVRQWAQELANNKVSDYAWHIGHGGLAVCEYFLRTGDGSVMPVIQQMVDFAARDQAFGGWAGRSGMAAVNYGGGGGHLNAGGTLVVPFLMLAKECGAEVPEDCLQSALTHYYRWAGRGNVPYGNNLPGNGFAENGKNARLAFAMAAAAALTPDGEKSIYAGARDVAAMFSFYSSAYMNHGHTGGGIGEIWRSAAMGLLYEKRPGHYRAFMDSRRWHYEMSRRFDGSFGILNGEGFYKLNGYDTLEWGAGLPLAYTIPRKHLRLAGAPPTKFSKLYKLPEIPWGTKADADFVTLDSPALPDGTRIDWSRENHADDSGMGQNRRFANKVHDADTITRYMHHENIAVRALAAAQLVNHAPSFTLGFLNSKDARVRRSALDGMREEQTAGKLSTPENIRKVFALLADPEESWFVKDGALRLIGTFPAEAVAPHIDAIIPFLQHQEWWLQHGALVALTPVAGHPECFRKVLPAVGGFLKTNKLYNASHPLRKGEFFNNVAKGGPEVIALAEESMKEGYSGYLPWQSVQEDAQEAVNNSNREIIVQSMAQLPGGYQVLYDMLTQLYPDESLPYKKMFLTAKAEDLGPALRKTIADTALTKLIPDYVAQNRKQLLREAASTLVDKAWRGIPKRSMDKLVEYYQQAFIHDYDWKDFGFPREEMTWHYHSFDPPETQPWDLVKKPRYRPVTLPAGMENYFTPGFDPAKAGWKHGLQPIGINNEGELKAEGENPCYDFCRCHTAMKTLWEKEVLLVKGRFQYPAFRKGHCYRLLIGGMAHVGAGEGFKIHINGKPLYERKDGTGKRQGAMPIGYMLDETWWPEFNGKEVDISAIMFQGRKDDVVKANFSLWIQEMKVPPLE
jgi:hypothetical protein